VEPRLAPGSPLIVVENFEREPSRWLLAEYVESHRVARSYGYELIVSNVSNPSMAASLESLRIPYTLDPGSTVCPGPCTIVTDLRAPKPLEPYEPPSSCCIVVGGILGDHPPRGRGIWLRLYHPDAAYRNLGDKQLSIDGAVKVVLEVLNGRRLEEIGLAYPAVLRVQAGLSQAEITLPYAYPLRGGKPWIAPELAALLSRGLMWES